MPEQTGTGKKGSPHRYWLVAKPPDAFFRSKPSPPSEESISPDPTAAVESTREAVQGRTKGFFR